MFLIPFVIFLILSETTGNASSKNIPYIGKNVPNTMRALDDIRNIFQILSGTYS